MTKLTIGIVDEQTGTLLLNDELGIDTAAFTGQALSVGCARPGEDKVQTPVASSDMRTARVSGYWHDDLMVGPGRRSVIRFQGCPIRCVGCWVPETHDEKAGYVVGIEQAAQALLDPAYNRDGVTILGGEPFAQPEALAALIDELDNQQPGIDIAVYSGFTAETLLRRAETDVDVLFALSGISMLIDGPYVQRKAHSATCGCDDETRLWTGSCNQSVRRLR